MRRMPAGDDPNFPAATASPAPALSVAIACRNEIRCIRRVLESVRPLVARTHAPGEIVAVDSGSTDGTLDVLREFNARVVQTEWRGFVATKQFVLEQCVKPWVLCLDGDEPLEPELARAVADLLDRDEPAVVGARLNRKVYYDGRPLDHAWQPEWRLRLVRRGTARWGGIDPHDKLDVLQPATPNTLARVIDLPGNIRHESIPSFAEFLRKQAGLARVSAGALHAAGKRGSLLALATSPAGAFIKQLVLKQAFRDGWPGWLAAASHAAGTLMKHAILIELSRRPHSPFPPAPDASDPR